MGVLEAFEESVSALTESGSLDKHRSAAAIEAARKVAAYMDTPGWPVVDGRLDNVSPSVFLKYCDALGVTAGRDIVGKAKATTGKTPRMAVFVDGSKFAKAANE